MSTSPKALLFDVFGTVVDWRSSVAAGLEAYLSPKGLFLDWEQLAMDWRGLYQPAMEAVRSGMREYVVLDILHRENLKHLAAARELVLAETDLDELTLLWHRLDPWPDSAAGIAALRQAHVVAPLSNGNIALMVALARHGGLVWDAILGADIAGTFKPAPEVYLSAARALDLPPSDCMMVAAHNDDLRAARDLGMQTAFVLRPQEYGPGQSTDLSAEQDWDIVTNSLTGVAAALDR